MKNYYYILGVNKKATPEQIKVAYRKLSKKYHPDVNNGDIFFEERFKELQEAYEILLDSKRRNNYDIESDHYFSDSNNDEEIREQKEFYQNIYNEFKIREKKLVEDSFFELINDLKQIFIYPRKVFRVLFNKNYSYANLHLLAIILILMQLFQESLFSDEESKISSFVVDITIALVAIIAFLHLSSYAILLVQKIDQGIATYKELFSAFVISIVPTAVSFILLVILRALTGDEAYDTLQLFITLPLGVYNFFVIIIGVSEAQQVSKRMAFFNLLLSGIFILVPLIGVYFVIELFS